MRLIKVGRVWINADLVTHVGAYGSSEHPYIGLRLAGDKFGADVRGLTLEEVVRMVDPAAEWVADPVPPDPLSPLEQLLQRYGA